MKRVMHSVLFLSLCALLFPKSVYASFEDGFEAAKKGNYVEASLAFLEGARKGDAKAQTALGFIYLGLVDGMLVDKGKAIEWFQRAAEQNEMFAQYQLSLAYRDGAGKALKKNHKLAVEWATKAAAQGHLDAQNNLGSHYYLGQGTRRNYDLAADWYKKSAWQGSSLAQRNLGAVYVAGHGVPKDIETGYTWLTVSARQGDRLARENKIYTSYDLNYSQINEAEKRAKEIERQISESMSRIPKSELQALIDFRESCIPIPKVEGNDTTQLSGISIQQNDGGSWCYYGAKSDETRGRYVTSVASENDPSLYFLELNYLEARELDNQKKLLKFAKKKKLTDKVFGGKVGKIKYSSIKTISGLCIRYRRTFRSKSALTDLVEGLTFGASVLAGLRPPNYSGTAYITGLGLLCKHPKDSEILVTAELLRFSQQRPDEKFDSTLSNDAEEYYRAITYTKLDYRTTGE